LADFVAKVADEIEFTGGSISIALLVGRGFMPLQLNFLTATIFD
jgi:hypothetical protein